MWPSISSEFPVPLLLWGQSSYFHLKCSSLPSRARHQRPRGDLINRMTGVSADTVPHLREHGDMPHHHKGKYLLTGVCMADKVFPLGAAAA